MNQRCVDCGYNSAADQFHSKRRPNAHIRGLAVRLVCVWCGVAVRLVRSHYHFCYTFAWSQFLPSVNLDTNIAQTLSPVALRSVAMGSTSVPMIIAAGSASGGKP